MANQSSPRRSNLSWLRNWRPWAVVAVIVAAIIGYRALTPDSNDEASLVTAVVERGNIENLVTATGTLQPRDYVDVGAQVSGQLKNLLVEVGSEVKQGDLLAEIDATVYIANVDATRAQLRNQKAQMRDREATLKLAELSLKRQQNLFKAEATTREALDNAEASLVAAKAQIESLSAQIEQTESSLRAEEAKLEFASIYAPMDGTIVSIAAKQGQTLNANQTAPLLMRIADLSTVTVKAQVSEADVGKVKANMPVYFTTLGSEGRRWYSKVERIEPTPENLNNVILYNVLFNVPNTSRELMSDMTAQIFFVVGDARNVLTVPVSALNYLPLRPEGRSPRGQATDASSDELNNRSRPAPTQNLSSEKHSSIGDETTNSAHKSQSAKGSENIARRPRPNLAPLNEGERHARVQVVAADGALEERIVVIGVTNRVTAEVKSGLAEGETVVLNTKRTAAPASGQQSRGPMGPPRMMR